MRDGGPARLDGATAVAFLTLMARDAEDRLEALSTVLPRGLRAAASA